MAVLRWAYKKTREYARRFKFYRGEVQASHPLFSSTSQAAAHQNATGPVAVSAPDIVYTAEDDRKIGLSALLSCTDDGLMTT